jgi:hypothetical protein
MDRLLQFLLKTFIRRGTFRVTTSRGTVFAFGDGTGRPVSVRFATRAAEWGILLDPELKFGECYMNGSFVIEQGSIADVLAICLGQNTDVPHWAWLQTWLRYLRRRFSQFDPRPRSRRNVAHHYDLDGRLYSLFLDADRQYSYGHFQSPDQSLDDAQLAKKRHLAAKLRLSLPISAQIAIAWVLSRGKDIVPIIGARRQQSLAESLAALDVVLSPEDLLAIEKALPNGTAAGSRYAEAQMAHLDSERG